MKGSCFVAAMSVVLRMGSGQAQITPPDSGLASATRETAAQRAYRQFLATGAALVLDPAHAGGYTQFPFGYGEAKVACARLHACPIELQPKERLLDNPLVGDTERWLVEISKAGRDGEVVLVIIKPTDCNLSTNMLIPTDKRVYMISLASEQCAKSGTQLPVVIQRTKFWYPDEMRELEREREHAVFASPCESDAISVNRAYELKQRGSSFLRRSRAFDWTPEKICDDSVRTYIHLPARARHSELPILYQVGEDGEKEMLNYVLRGDVLITDRVLHRGALIVNTGGKERRIDIENRGRLHEQRGGGDAKR